MAEINLHELANNAPYGQAEKILKAEGLWKEELATGARKYKFRVTAEARTEYTQDVEVFANSIKEAEERACEVAEENDGKWQERHEGDYEITDAQLLSSEEDAA